MIYYISHKIKQINFMVNIFSKGEGVIAIDNFNAILISVERNAREQTS